MGFAISGNVETRSRTREPPGRSAGSIGLKVAQEPGHRVPRPGIAEIT
jgi:hypothetical protein